MMVRVTTLTPPGEWSYNPSRAYGPRHQSMTARHNSMTAGMVRVTVRRGPKPHEQSDAEAAAGVGPPDNGKPKTKLPNAMAD